MTLQRNLKSISKLAFILWLLAALVAGAFLSYLWVEGYYLSLDLHIPEKTSITITNATFSIESTSTFNLTVLNPSFSPSKAEVTQISALTKDGVSNDITFVDPLLPYTIPKSGSKTFLCNWNWANYTGENVTIIALTADSTGAIFQAETPLVKLTMTDLIITPRSEWTPVTQINMTVQNAALSAIDVNITGVYVNFSPRLPIEEPNVTLPYALERGAKLTITGKWNWTDYEGKDLAIAVQTEQGFTAYYKETVPPITPAVTITEVVFNDTDTNHFEVDIQNSDPTTERYISVTTIGLTLDNGTVIRFPEDLKEVSPPLEPAYVINPNNSTTFTCTWNWINYRSRNVTIKAYTLQSFEANYTETTP